MTQPQPKPSDPPTDEVVYHSTYPFGEKAQALWELGRWHRPVGIWLLLLPGIWSLILASHMTNYAGIHIIGYTFLFVIGAGVMRAAGCTVNDMLDAKIDAKVSRTKSRPLPSGRIKLWEAAIYALALSAIGLLVLLQLPQKAVGIAILSVPLILLYPLAKRVTHWPQAVLGIVFNTPVIVAWITIRGGVDWPLLSLYAAAFFWTVAYDTIYAWQDIASDKKIGVKSTAILLDGVSRPFVASCYSMMMILLFTTGFLLHLKGNFYVLIAIAIVQIVWILWFWKPENILSSGRAFKRNILLGVTILVACILGIR